MIYLKSKWKIFFKTLAISLGCCAVFVGVGYFYLDSSTKEQTQNEVSSVPYAYVPESAGVLFDVSGDKTLFYLDFEGKSVSVIIADGINEAQQELYGYSIDYIVEADYNLLEGIIDAVGGVELKSGEEELAFTGVQVVETLTTTPESEELRREIITKILSKIAINGFSRQDFLYIIENSETNLTVPACYYWQDYINELCKTVRTVM